MSEKAALGIVVIGHEGAAVEPLRGDRILAAEGVAPDKKAGPVVASPYGGTARNSLDRPQTVAVKPTDDASRSRKNLRIRGRLE